MNAQIEAWQAEIEEIEETVQESDEPVVARVDRPSVVNLPQLNELIHNYPALNELIAMYIDSCCGDLRDDVNEIEAFYIEADLEDVIIEHKG